jgi:hypothetical protein
MWDECACYLEAACVCACMCVCICVRMCVCCSCGDRVGPTTLASANTCAWAAFLATTSALQARGTWARRCRSTRR